MEVCYYHPIESSLDAKVIGEITRVPRGQEAEARTGQRFNGSDLVVMGVE